MDLLQRAKLASTSGAGILGFGLGAALAGYFGPYSYLIIAIGIAMHGWGMYNSSGMGGTGRAPGKNPLGGDWLYWLCWVLLALLAAYVAIGLL